MVTPGKMMASVSITTSFQGTRTVFPGPHLVARSQDHDAIGERYPIADGQDLAEFEDDARADRAVRPDPQPAPERPGRARELRHTEEARSRADVETTRANEPGSQRCRSLLGKQASE